MKKWKYLGRRSFLLVLGFLFSVSLFLFSSSFDFSSVPLQDMEKVAVENRTAALLNVSLCPSNDCHALLLSTIEKAQRSIDCAFYDLTLEEVAEALATKHDEGVRVRLMVDDGNRDREMIVWLSNHIGALRDDAPRESMYNNFMHHKFCVVDDRYVYTGSANPTYNGMFRHNNEVYLFEGAYIAALFREEFRRLYDFHQFGASKTSAGFSSSFPLRYAEEVSSMEVFFCPQDHCLAELSERLVRGEDRITFASFAFTHEHIEDLLIRADSRGVLVRGVFEEDKAGLRGSDVEALEQLGLAIPADNPHRLHHKLFVIDGEWVITGSMNPSKAGVSYNDEVLLVLYQPRLARQLEGYLLEEFYG